MRFYIQINFINNDVIEPYHWCMSNSYLCIKYLMFSPRVESQLVKEYLIIEAYN